jgi:hypothetical protein
MMPLFIWLKEITLWEHCDLFTRVFDDLLFATSPILDEDQGRDHSCADWYDGRKL